MAEASWYSANRTTVKRSEGRNAVACAAYCAGAKLYDATERTTHDYTRRRGVVEAFVTTPEGKDNLDWAHDVECLSNVMESSERRKDAQVGHVWRFSLPASLDADGRSAITHEAAQKLSDLYGVAVIAGIHLPDPKSDDDRNHHAHLLFTTRTVEPDGKLGAKVTSITSPKTSDAEVTRYREIVADIINDALDDAGLDERVTHLSFKARGITDIEPTIHLGPSASSLERRGELTDRGDINREIIEAREAIEARLVWQRDVAQPEVDAAIAADLAQRFGDDFAGVLQEAQAGPRLPGIEEHATQNATPLNEDTASSGSSDMLAEPRGWRERIKALASHALALLHDQTSGAPTPEPEATTPHSAPEPQPGLISRGWGALLRAFATPADSAKAESPDEPNREPARPAAPVDAAEPDDRPQEAGQRPMTAFERLAASVDASKREPRDKPVSAFDKLAEAYQRALRDPPEPEGDDALEGWERFHRSAHAEPAPDQPEPEPKAPEQDFGPEL
jgi:hypothetical protein